MITPAFSALESKFERIARIMTARMGVKVAIRGRKAYINLKTMEIVLPAMSDQQASALVGLLDGFLDHECGHALYTDGEALAAAKEPTLHRITNVLEDVRIESLQAELPGVAQNIRKLNDALYARAEEIMAKGEGDKLARLGYALERCWKGDREVSAYAFDPGIGSLLMALAPEVREGRLARSTKDAVDIATRIVAKMKSMAEGDKPEPEQDKDDGASSESKGEKSEPGKGEDATGPQGPEQEPDTKDQGESDDGSGTAEGETSETKDPETKDGDAESEESLEKSNEGKGQSKSDDSGAEGDANGSGGESEDEGTDDSEFPDRGSPEAGGPGADGGSERADRRAAPSGASDDDGGGEDSTEGSAPSGAGEGPEGADSGPADSADGPASDEAGAGGELAPGEGEVTPEAMAEAKDVLKDARKGGLGPSLDAEGLVNDHIMAVLEEGDGDGDPKHYVVFSTEYDEEITYSMSERAAHTKLYGELKQQARATIGAMTNALEAALFARTQARWVGGEKHGKHFDRRRVQSWMMGSEDERIFRYKEEGEKLDTAITLLWDCSGSMGSSSHKGNKAELSRIAAVAFHEALNRVGVPHEVLGFNTGSVDPNLVRLRDEARRMGDDMSRYSRVEQLNNHMVFVPYGQTDGRAICEITGGSSNRDGEAVLWASRRLAQRQETRKILIVGSDGQPAGARYHTTECNYLREVVSRAIAAGIEVYGIGIMDRSVERYYPTWVVVKNAEELPRVVMTQLREALASQEGRNDRKSAKRSA